MSYSVTRNEEGSYDIMEKCSETLIQIKKQEEKDARSICRKLNLGAGFMGYTPNFIAKRMICD